MRIEHVLLGLLASTAAAAACASSKDNAAAARDGGSDALGTSADSGRPDAPAAVDASFDAVVPCTAPDVLLVLDRTLGMRTRPDGTRPLDTPADHAESRWYLAIQAVKAVTAAPADAPIRFGLELFPRDPGGAQCVTLSEGISGKAATNLACEEAELTVPLASSAGATIASALDPETTRLCGSAPLAAALGFAGQKLALDALPGRAQVVVVVTDGNDTCQADALAATQVLAAAGARMYFVGFGQPAAPDGGGSGLNVGLLNSLACAGQTAKGFEAACQKGEAGTGYVARDPTGSRLFYGATTGDDLSKALKSILASACCGCGK